ncbi:MAG: 4-(cytidine 5'-diphospho)-2-C-methyl-D-erythritol kinase [Marinifilaceae bacterium]
MITFPNAKINIGLNVVKKREDGFHNIETVFYPLTLTDILEIIENKDLPKGEYTYTSYGIEIDCSVENNIIIKAYNLIAHDYDIPGIDIFFHKNIPFGGGLGGGSADAAYMLKLLNDKFSLSLTTEQLEDYASRIGSDCAFFIKNEPVYAYGRGELFKEINFSLKGKYIVLVKPNIAVPTGKAYSGIKPQASTFDLKDLSSLSLSEWKDKVNNDFEKTVFKAFPAIKNLKDKLYSLGAEYAVMTGSGATVYGIFNKEVDLSASFEDCFYWAELL